jgi:hypothetical protein
MGTGGASGAVAAVVACLRWSRLMMRTGLFFDIFPTSEP